MMISSDGQGFEAKKLTKSIKKIIDFLFYFLIIFYNKLKILKLIKIFKTLLFIIIISFAVNLRANSYWPKQSNRFEF